MSKRKPFIIHPGAGGLEGRARLFDEQARGAHNERIYQWLKERATSHGMGNPPQAAGEIVVPVANLIWTGNGLQAANGYLDGAVLPVAGPSNTWPTDASGLDSAVAMVYRNTAGGTGQFLESTDTAFDLPVLDQSYLRINQITGNADGFSDNDGGAASLGGIADRQGVTGQGWCWFMVVRQWNRQGLAGSTSFGTVLGGRKVSGTNKGYGIFTRSGGGLSTWTTNIWWVVGTTPFGVSGTQNLPIGVASSDWVVYAVQSEPGLFKHGASRDYQNLETHVRTGDIVYRDAVDGNPHFQFALDGSNNGGGDIDHAEYRYFDHALTPAEFNIVMAELLIKYDMPVL